MAAIFSALTKAFDIAVVTLIFSALT